MPAVESVQVGRARQVASGRRAEHSGIDKQPQASICCRVEGVYGDSIVSTQHHGGPGQAVYIYTRADYTVFEQMLDVPLPGGSFGENLTVDALPEPVRIGDRLVIGEVTLEITAPRVPCSTFAARMSELVGADGAKGWVARFTAARRPGWYARVITEGEVVPGLRVDVEPGADDTLTGLEMWDLYHDASPSAEAIARALKAPIADRARAAWSP